MAATDQSAGGVFGMKIEIGVKKQLVWGGQGSAGPPLSPRPHNEGRGDI